jgi:choline dehydrogenase
MGWEPDFIVVGAGSAGCALAARLSEDPDTRVLLVEAGGRDRDPLLRVPLMTGLLLRGGLHAWRFTTEPDPGLNGRSLAWPRGRVLGGSSAINGMVWMRGRPSDYDAWAQRGLRGWAWEDVLPAFRRIEDFAGGESVEHGTGGPLPVTDGGAESPLLDAFVEAGVAAGWPRAADFNAPPYEGFGRYHFTISAGRRVSSARGYLRPAMERPNLRLATRLRALHVMVEGGRCTGLAVLEGRDSRVIRAAREVVLCAGAIGSPMLLLHGGIGPGEALQRAGITVRHDLPCVGRNLQDHLLVRVEHACTQPITLHRLSRPDRAAAAVLRAMAFGSGPAASFPLAAGALIRSHPGEEEPDLQSHFLPALSTAAMRLPFLPSVTPRAAHGFMANCYVLRPESRGWIEPISDDPLAPPRIVPNYLSTHADRMRLRAGIRHLRTVFAQAPFDGYRGEELSPGPAVQSDAELDTFVATTADTAYHPVGTCAMGCVLDETLRVRGIAGLRVADASSMPAIPSGNTHAPSVMIAERCAEMMRA